MSSRFGRKQRRALKNLAALEQQKAKRAIQELACNTILSKHIIADRDTTIVRLTDRLRAITDRKEIRVSAYRNSSIDFADGPNTEITYLVEVPQISWRFTGKMTKHDVQAMLAGLEETLKQELHKAVDKCISSNLELFDLDR